MKRFSRVTCRPSIGPLSGVILTALLASCHDTPTRTGTELPGYSFDYLLENREATGLIQAFDDGHNTYLQFANLTAAKPSIRTEQANVAFTQSASFAILTGRYAKLVVSVQGADSVVTTNARVAAETIAPLTAVSPPPSKALDADKVETSTLRVHIAELESELTAVTATLASLEPKLVIYFANNSARINLSEDTLQAIAAALRERDQIAVVGYTDAQYPNEAGENLARRRAENVSAALMRQGIAKPAFKLRYHAAGEFAVANVSTAGKALNRRVEITAASLSANLSR